MPRFHKLRTLPHPARSLFDLVLDIETYPQFLPWCLDARISNRRHEQYRVSVALALVLFKEHTLAQQIRCASV